MWKPDSASFQRSFLWLLYFTPSPRILLCQSPGSRLQFGLISIMVHMLDQSLRNLDKICMRYGAITCAGSKTFPVFSMKLYLRDWLFLNRNLIPSKTKQKNSTSFSACNWFLLAYKMFDKHNKKTNSLELLMYRTCLCRSCFFCLFFFFHHNINRDSIGI